MANKQLSPGTTGTRPIPHPMLIEQPNQMNWKN